MFPLTVFSLEGMIQPRVGYFYFANHTAREIYHTGTPDVELEGALLINRFFIPWINVNYVWKEGASDPLSDRTMLEMVTMSSGSKMEFPTPSSVLKFYLGFGLTAAYLYLNDDSPYVPEKTHRWGMGVVGKSGALIRLHQRLFFDVFFDYYYQLMRTSSSLPERYINLGGFRVGGGLRTSF